MPLKLLVKSLLQQYIFIGHLKHKTINKTTPIMCTVVEELSNCYDYFLRLSEFPDLFGDVFLILFKFSFLDFSTILGESNANKTS